MLHCFCSFFACPGLRNSEAAPCLARRPRLEHGPTAGRVKSPAMVPGEVAEWSNAPHSKCGIGASLSGVRIPPSPPETLPPSFADVQVIHNFRAFLLHSLSVLV